MSKAIQFIRNILHDIVMIYAPKAVKRRVMSCQAITELMQDKKRLTLSKKFWYQMHIFICQCCTNYSSQLKIIEGQAKDLDKVELTPEQKARIAKTKQSVLDKIAN